MAELSKVNGTDYYLASKVNGAAEASENKINSSVVGLRARGRMPVWFKADDYVNTNNLSNAGTLTFTFNPSGPVTNTATFSGGTTNQGVFFDDNNDTFNLSADQTITSTGLTIFYVMNATNIANTDMILAGDTDSRNQIHHYNKRNIQVRFNSDGNTTNAGVTLNTYSTTRDDSGVTAYDFSSETDEIAVIRKAASGQKLTVFNRKKELIYSKSENDAEDATTSPATYTGGSNNGIRIARIGIKSGGGSPAGGHFGDIGIYDQDLSDAKVNAVIDYLATKFGVSQS
jgi:hypothetical protein